MRSRTNYHFAPAQGNVVYAPQQAAPPMPADIVNYDRLLMLLFFAVIPFLWVVSLMLSGFLWLVFLAILGTLALLWLKRGFTARGRMSMTGIYAVFAVLAITALLQGGPAGAGNFPSGNHTMQPISEAAPTPAAPPAITPQADRQPDAMPGMLMQGGNSEAEQVLRQFLEGWKTGMVTDMVPLTAFTWRQKANVTPNGAEQSLYALISGGKLESYVFEGDLTGTENDTSRTIHLVCQMTTRGELRTVRYQALLLNENAQWLVDPSSLMGGTTVGTPTPGPGEVGYAGSAPTATSRPTPTPRPTARPRSNLKLYYNSQGGQFYHVQARCTAVNSRYFPLKSFTYGNINRAPQRDLSPCPTCNAPGR